MKLTLCFFFYWEKNFSRSSYLCYNVIQGLNIIGTSLGHEPDVQNQNLHSN